MHEMERLSAIEAIKALKARYFRYMDGKDWKAFEGLFTGDARFDMRSARGDQLDPDALVMGAHRIAAFVRSAVGELVTVHHGHMPEIEFTDERSARAVWAMEDRLVVPESVMLPFRRMHGFGHYHDTYRCVDGQWRIESSRLTRLRVDVC